LKDPRFSFVDAGQRRGLRPALVLGDYWIATGRSCERAHHVLELRSATGLRRAKGQRGAIVRDAVVGARPALDGDPPVLTFGLGTSARSAALGQRMRFYFREHRFPIGRPVDLRLAA